MSRLLGLVAAGSVLLSCASDREVGPPEIAVGFDVCARCGMSIDDLRFAAAARIDGEILAYDDVGELVAALEGRARPVEGSWVRDFEADAWIEARKAWFVERSGVLTPMASATVAFTDRAAAARLADASGGRVVAWSDLDPYPREGGQEEARQAFYQQD